LEVCVIKSVNVIERDKEIINKMIHLYCKKKHKSKGCLCSECEDLLEYSCDRLSNCVYLENKPVCKNCDIHCYSPAMKDWIIRVMKYSGPRMIIYHPFDIMYYLSRKSLKKSNRS
jgi:hypothetical protein